MATAREIQNLARSAGLGESAIRAVRLPDGIVQFASDPAYLGLSLYPRQGTLLKMMTADLDAFTEYDVAVAHEWSGGFTLDSEGGTLTYKGERGVPADLLERMSYCKGLGLPWFRECILVIGRRGSKSFIVSVMLAWCLWRMLAMDDPQAHYQIPATKKLVVPIFGTDQYSVQRDGFGDLLGLLESSPCFQPYLGARKSTSISLLTPTEIRGGARRGNEGSIVVSAAPSTATAGRGPSSPVLWFDEMAHVQGAGSTADSLELYGSAVPATGQFSDALILQSSTPWEMTGQLYKSYIQALEMSPTTGRAVMPESFVVQLESPALYVDAETAGQIPMWPSGPTYPNGLSPKLSYEFVEKQLKIDPDRARIEWLAQFGTVVNQYLLPDRVADVFAPFNGRVLEQDPPPMLARTYVAHADPSRSNANFAFVIGHVEEDDGIPHVVFDVVRHWEPRQFPDGIIDYLDVNESIYSYLKRFRLEELTFDQYSSTQTIQDLQRRARLEGLTWHPQIHERTSTAELNDRMYETFKTAINAGVVHSPTHALALAELQHLALKGSKVVAPTSGPVTTKDISDAMANVAWTLLRDRTHEIVQALSRLPVSGTQPGGLRASARFDSTETPHHQLSNFGRVHAYQTRQMSIRRA